MSCYLSKYFPYNVQSVRLNVSTHTYEVQLAKPEEYGQFCPTGLFTSKKAIVVLDEMSPPQLTWNNVPQIHVPTENFVRRYNEPYQHPLPALLFGIFILCLLLGLSLRSWFFS